jgi:MoxR-like ATPase
MSTHDIELPTYRDLMLPTLQALDRLGGTATIEVLHPEVAKVAKLTPEQVAAEFRPDQTQTGSIVSHRCGWARTYLKQAGAVHNPESGQWELLARGREFLAMPGDDAQDAIIEAGREADRARRIEREQDRHEVRSAANERYAPVYEVASRWRETSLGAGRSLIDPSTLVWLPEAAADLKHRFVDSFDESARSFAEKLDDQMAAASQEACLLMADLMYMHFLPLRSVGAQRKLDNINAVGFLAPEPFEVPETLEEPLGLGMINGGAGYNTNRFYLVSLLIEFSVVWSGLEEERRLAILSDPWEFKQLLVDLPQERAGAQRNAVLFLLYPEVFEDIAANGHKKRIVSAFPADAGESADLDRQVLSIRNALKPAQGDDFSWYSDAVRPQWDKQKAASKPRKRDSTATEDIEEIFPDPADRQTIAEVLADAVDLAHGINPNSWSVSRRHDGITLNVANNRMLGLFPSEDLGFGVTVASNDESQALTEAGLNLREPYSFPGDVVYATTELDRFVSLLRPRSDQFLSAVRACACRNTPFWGSHSDEAVEAIEEEVGRSLPRPPDRQSAAQLTGQGAVLDQSAWIVRVKRDGRSEAQQALDRGDVRVFWELHVEPGATFDEIKEAFTKADPELGTHSAGTQAGNLYRFVTRMQPGDIVLLPEGSDLYFGTVDGDASFDTERNEWVRPVVWTNTDSPVDRSEVSPELYSRLRSLLTVTDITEMTDEVAGYVSDRVEVPAPAVPEIVLPSVDAETADGLLVGRDWLQEIVEMLQAKRQVIFYGPPGTGKTFLAQKLAEFLATDGSYKLVQFHPSYSYEDFVEGFRPKVNADGSMIYELKPGPLIELAEAARANPADPYFLLIDEINRGNLAKIFGELYYLLEYRGEGLVLQYRSGDDEFSLPKNLFVIGTMNTADRSIAMVDAAIRRRFYFVEFSPTEPPISDMLPRWLAKKRFDKRPARLLDELNRRLDDADYAIGPSYLMTDRIDDDAELARVWQYGIMPLLAEHFYGQRDVKEQFGLAAIQRSLAGALDGRVDQVGDSQGSETTEDSHET